MYEKKSDELVSRKKFVLRLLWHLLAAFLLVAATLLLGVLGHVYFEDIPLHDAFLNTALIVGGIGATIIPTSVGGKLFLAAYGTFVSLIFAAVVGVALAPVIHRIIHKMHLDDNDD